MVPNKIKTNPNPKNCSKHKSNHPQVSNNLKRHNPNPRNNKPPPSIDNNTKNNTTNSNANPKIKIVPEPAPFTVIHSFATRLRTNQANMRYL